MEKSTNGYEKSDKIELLQLLSKTTNGKYVAVLSDDSIDREGDIMGKSALQGIMDDAGTISILMDHENKINSLIGEWVERRIEYIDGHNALVAEPKFYKSNPNAQMIKGMLDEGAQIGISIGAIPKNAKETKIDGKTHREFTSLELLEASFVAIPANKHAHAMAIAKSFNFVDAKKDFDADTIKSMEENTMSEEQITKSEPQAEEVTKTFEVEFNDLQKKYDDLEKSKTDELTKAIENNEALEKTVKDNVDKLVDANAKIESLEKDLEAAKDKPVFKADGATVNDAPLEKDIEGKLPIMHF